MCWQSNCAKGNPSDKEGFSNLVTSLNSAFAPENLVLAGSVSGYPKVLDMAYDLPLLARNMDFVNVMTYDYYGFWDEATGHHSPLKPVTGSKVTVPGYSTVSVNPNFFSLLPFLYPWEGTNSTWLGVWLASK